MKITENFTMEEFFRSAKADSLKIDNTPTEKEKANINRLVIDILQPIRDKFGNPITVSSGYRCEKLNKAVNGSPTSAHRFGNAADLKAKDMKAFQRCVLEWAKTNKFDQVIIEYPDKNHVASWIHIGIFNSSGKQRKQIIYTKDGKNYPAITKEYYV